MYHHSDRRVFHDGYGNSTVSYPPQDNNGCMLKRLEQVS